MNLIFCLKGFKYWLTLRLMTFFLQIHRRKIKIKTKDTNDVEKINCHVFQSVSSEKTTENKYSVQYSLFVIASVNQSNFNCFYERTKTLWKCWQKKKQIRFLTNEIFSSFEIIFPLNFQNMRDTDIVFEAVWPKSN